jgi:asparagine synthase (glutamine-hydrolysing)
MPMSLKIDGGWTKRGLRDAMTGVLPEPIRWRKDKKGFVTPEVIWLRAGKQRIREELSGTLASSEFLDGAQLRRTIERQLDGADEGAFRTELFRWLSLELWLRSAFR